MSVDSPQMPGDAADAADGGPTIAAFMYAASDFAPSQIYGYLWDQVTGRLTPIDMDSTKPGIQGVPADDYVIALASHPNGKWIYTVDESSNPQVSGYAVDPKTGVLSRMHTDARVDGGTGGVSLGFQYVGGFIAMDPKGRCLYVQDETGSLIALTIDPMSGALTIARTVATAGGKWLAVDSQARFLVAAASAGTVTQVALHRLDAVSGLPVGVDGGAGAGDSYMTTTGSAGTVALDKQGMFAFVPDALGKHVSGFRIDQTTFAMTALSPTSVGTEPQGIIADPNAAYLYTGGTNGTGMDALAIGDGGLLTELGSDAGVFTTVGIPLSLDPTATHLYMTAYPLEPAITFMDVKSGTLAGRGRADDGGPATFPPARTFAWVRP